ncbi:acyltransferase [Bradyrhizobium sp. A5]|uniref:acyltransferase family protein n=1 Tax=Bradyrhizobium sp. A5 TaxID=3133696 RepID=UPI0032463D86
MSISVRIHHIQALRGIAASAVVLDHALGPLVRNGILPSYFDDVRYNIGNLGVIVFFIVSGFIMIRTNRDRFGTLGNAKEFFLRRLTRILPIYWIGTFCAFIFVALVAKEWRFIDLGLSLAFVPYFDATHGVMKPILSVGWTLNYEMFFYAVFAVAMLLPLRAGVSFITAVFVILVGSHLLFVGPGNPARTAVLFFTEHIVLLFIIGIFIGLFARNPRIPYPFIVACFMFGLMCVAYTCVRSLDDISFPTDLLMWVPAACVVILCSGEGGEGGVFAKLAEKFGDASYSTYIFNVFVVAALAKVMPVSSRATGLVFVLVALVASNLLGLSISRWIENPMLKNIRRILDRNIGGLRAKKVTT